MKTESAMRMGINMSSILARFWTSVGRVKYFVSFHEDRPPSVVDVVELPSGALDVTLDGKPVEVDALWLGQTLSIRIDGHVIDLTTEGVPPEIGAIASGHRSYVKVESERQRAAAAANKGASGSSDKAVKSPMPGRVIKLLVAVGAVVAAGDSLVVVEAMKMENEVKAKRAGTIATVAVQVGATVEGNALLMSFE
jgi:biotin carboxyl carrier protein